MIKNIFLFKFTSLVICFVLFTMCQSKNEIKLNSTLKPDDLIELNIDKLETERPISFSSIFKGIKLIPLETKEESLIGEIDQLEIFEDTIYVLDSHVSKSLLLFNISGKYIRKVGQLGKGPGEYIQPSNFSIDFKKKQIQILDSQLRKVIIYSTRGKLIQEIKLINTNSIPIQIATQDDFIYVDQLITKDDNVDYLMYAINKIGEIKSKWFPYKIYSKGFKQPFNCSINIFKTKDDIKYVKPLFDTIFSLKENNVKPFMVVLTKNRVTSEDIQTMNLIKDIRQFIDYYSSNCSKFMGVTNYIESSKLIYFKFKNNKITYDLFYWPENKEVYCTNNLINDLTQTEFSQFYSTSENRFVSCIQNTFPDILENFIEKVKDEKIKLSEKEKSAIETLTPNSNPIIVIYDCREEFVITNDLSGK